LYDLKIGKQFLLLQDPETAFNVHNVHFSAIHSSNVHHSWKLQKKH